jgi:cholesterol oxidase
MLAAKDRGLSLNYGSDACIFPVRTPREVPAAGIKFTEKMRGYFSTVVTNEDYAAAYEQGRSAQSPITVVVTVDCPDVFKLVADPKHEGSIVGTVAVPQLASSPMSARGKFYLFQEDLSCTDTRKMIYDMTCFDATTGSEFHLYGFKKITNGNILNLWPQTTTLYATISRKNNDQVEICGRGILHIHVLDFAKQMLTILVSWESLHLLKCLRMPVLIRPKPTGSGSIIDKAAAVLQFGKFFGQVLFDHYSRIFYKSVYQYDYQIYPRRKSLVANSTVFVTTRDAVEVRLMRYKGGEKGPVLFVSLQPSPFFFCSLHSDAHALATSVDSWWWSVIQDIYYRPHSGQFIGVFVFSGL